MSLSFNQEHSCEICGMSGLSDDNMRDHTRTCHIEGSMQCPFCGLTGAEPAELLLHVNQAHLDYLTPENELISFIDDQSPSVDCDSDSLSECNYTSPSTAAISPTFKLNDGFSLAATSNDQFMGNGKSSTDNEPVMPQPEFHTSSSCSSKSITQNGHNHCQNKGSNINVQYVNGLDESKSGSRISSPLRSQLDLNLKTNFPTPTALQCPLCPYSSSSSSVLEEHINRSHFDPLSPTNGALSENGYQMNTLTALQCPICHRTFESASDLELHVNIEHRDILSPAQTDCHNSETTHSCCPVCAMPMPNMSHQEMELHIESHFPVSPKAVTTKCEQDVEKQAQKIREQREFEMLRAQYGMDNQGNFREQSAASMQRAVYAGEMSVADYYERQVGLKAAESHGIDDGTSCTKTVSPRVISLSAASPSIVRSLVCTAVDHYASSYGDKGWGCGYRNLQMLLSSLLQNTTYNEVLYSAWGQQAPSRTAMPSISRLQKMVEIAWAQGFDEQGSEQLGCKLYNTRKWIGATEVVTVLSWLRINCQLIDFHRPTSPDGRHPELFNWVFRYFEEPKAHTPPLYLQHQGHSRTIIGIEQRSSGMQLLILDPSHGPRQVAALGTQDSLRLIRRGPAAMRAPQYQIVAIKGLIDTEEQYQASKILRSMRIPPD